MRHSSIPNSLFVKNRKKLINSLKKNSVAIVNSNEEMHRSGDQFFKYRPNADLFYLTGIEQEKSILFLFPDNINKKNREILFILEPNENLEIWQGHKLSKNEAQEISGIENIIWTSNFDAIFRQNIFNAENIYLNMNENASKSLETYDFNLKFIEKIKKHYPLHNYLRLSPIIQKFRLKKEPEEIELIKKACEITNKAFHRVLKAMKPNIKEYEIEAEITYEFLKNGADGHAYEPIVASGDNNCVLHYVSNDKVCNDGDLVLMDFGAEYVGYAADTTRTIPANGKFSDRQTDVYSAVLRVMKKAKKIMVSGTTINEINKKVNDFIAEELVNLRLAKSEEISDEKSKNVVRMKYYMHGTSHFMGLDVHDVGTKDTILEAGMVLSCEPGIYIKDEKLGIRLENDILITESGNIDLLENEPIEIEDIERLMAEK